MKGLKSITQNVVDIGGAQCFPLPLPRLDWPFHYSRTPLICKVTAVALLRRQVQMELSMTGLHVTYRERGVTIMECIVWPHKWFMQR